MSIVARRSIVIGLGVAAVLSATLSVAWAQGEVQYELTEDRIETARVVDHGDGTFTVAIQLTPQESKELARLTHANIGQRLAIVMAGQILIRPVVRARIDSGVILIGPWNSEAEAKAFLDALPLQHQK